MSDVDIVIKGGYLKSYNRKEFHDELDKLCLKYLQDKNNPYIITIYR